MIIPITEALLQGHVSVQSDEKLIQPWRLWYDKIQLFHDENFISRAACSAGVRLSFKSDAKAITLKVHCEGDGYFDLLSDNQMLQRVKVEEGSDSIHFNCNLSKESLTEIWLPQKAICKLQSLEVHDATFFEIPEQKQKKWITYGSSISQCGEAFGPSDTWPAIVAKQNDLHLTCLGYGGQCHIDGMMGKVITSLEADVITLKLGINVYGNGSLNKRSYYPAVVNLIHTIRSKFCTTPIGIITPIISPPREKELNAVGMSLEDYRIENRRVVETFKQYGDQSIFLYEGHDIFGEDYVDYLPDELHPNGLGYQLLGENFSKVVMKDLLSKV